MSTNPRLSHEMIEDTFRLLELLDEKKRNRFISLAREAGKADHDNYAFSIADNTLITEPKKGKAHA